MSKKASLRLVDSLADGEVPETAPKTLGEAYLVIDDQNDVIDGLQRKQAGLLIEIANLKREREAEALKHQLWPRAKRIHDYWREECKHPRSKFDADAFELARVILESEASNHRGDYDAAEAMMKRAIDGAAFDPFTTTRKNGSTKRHDGFDLIFRNRTKFEEFVNRAPRGGQTELVT